jgi:hypothetical protein
MIWLLGEPEDTDLLWLTVLLQRRGVNVEFVLPAELLIGSALTYRIDDSNVVSSLRLQDGRVINDDVQGLVVNRLVGIPPIGGAISPSDAGYLTEEWQAVLVAWLRTLRCPVLNLPRAGCLVGPTMPPAAWRMIANAHGLVCHPWISTEPASSTDVVDLVCLGSRCFDPSNSAPAAINMSLIKMAQFVGASLLGATFARDGDQWLFVEATAYPRFAQAGEQLVEAVIECASAQRLPA